MSKGIWITPAEISNLPVSGPAWESVLAAAESNWGAPKLNDQNNKHGLKVLAGAYVAVRMDSSALRDRVRAEIIAAKRTMDQPAHWGTSNGVLALGRLLPAYVFAADLVGLGADEPEWTDWLRVMQTQKIGTHGRWNTLPGCHEDDAANWAAFAGAARLSIAAYLGDQAEIDRCALILRSLCGDRALYPGGGYFTPSSGLHWSVGDAQTWVGINGPGSKLISGVERDVDGCAVIDTGDGALGWPPPSMSYPWECLQGWFVQAEMLHRLGFGAYEWSNQALKRALEFMKRAGWSITNPAKHVPWIANARYGTSFATTSPNTDGRSVTWTDWTHAAGSVIPPTDPAPDITGIFPTSGPTFTEVEILGRNLGSVTSVTFGLVPAPFNITSPGRITTSVPGGAVSAPIRVSGPTGTDVSASQFTVTTVEPPPAGNELLDILDEYFTDQEMIAKVAGDRIRELKRQ